MDAATWMRRHRLALLLTFAAILAFYFPVWMASNGHHVPVGVYIAVMGLVTAIMAFHEGPTRPEKFGWILFATALMVAEVRNLYTADREQARTFKQISDSLEATKSGLDSTAKGIQDSVSQGKQQFDATMRQFGNNVSTITGGNSFGVVWSPLLEVNQPNTFQLMLDVRGLYDLQDVHVEVVQLPEPGFGSKEWAIRSLTGTNPYVKAADLGNISHLTSKIIPIKVTAAADGSTTEYSVNVFSRNRMTHESLRIRKNLAMNEWESSVKVIDGDTHRTLEQSKPEWRGFKLMPPT